jgi:hypothetical protein
MIEYIYDAIKATADSETQITAVITDENDNPVIEGCALELFDDNALILSVDGYYYEGVWFFIIPAEITKDFKGRYWYCIKNADKTNLCFKQPIYFV